MPGGGDGEAWIKRPLPNKNCKYNIDNNNIISNDNNNNNSLKEYHMNMFWPQINTILTMRTIKNSNNNKQAGAELCQAQSSFS